MCVVMRSPPVKAVFIYIIIEMKRKYLFCVAVYIFSHFVLLFHFVYFSHFSFYSSFSIFPLLRKFSFRFSNLG